MSEEDDGFYARGRVPGRFYVSRQLPHHPFSLDPGSEPTRRFAYQVFDESGQVAFENENAWDLRIRETGTRQQLRARFFEDTRRIEHLTFQRFDAQGRRLNRECFTLSDGEVEELASFLALVVSRHVPLPKPHEGMRLTSQIVGQMLGDESVRLDVYRQYRSAVLSLVEADVRAPEVIAFARRSLQLQEFENLLNSEDALERRRNELRSSGKNAGIENVWQSYFEQNHWIFGAGLATQFLHSWNPNKLEQTVVGASIASSGKRPDALLQSAGILSAIAFVEIKTHQTPLLASGSEPDRPSVWRVSSSLSSGVAQLQATVDATIEQFGGIMRRIEHGVDSTEWALLARPRSVLVIGSLSEFVVQNKKHLDKFRSFERYRRSLRDPEIVTYDELLERARGVLALSESRTTSALDHPEQQAAGDVGEASPLTSKN